MTSDQPISTVYVHNLEERVKIQSLRESLKTVFSEFGDVVDIVAKKNLKAKGQAFIVFSDPEHAKEAVEELQGFQLFDKPMKLSLAKTLSDKSIEMKCSLEEYEAHKRHRLSEKEKRLALEAADNERQPKRGAGTTTDVRPSKLFRPSGLKSTGPAASQVIPDEYLPPNKILFLQNIPDTYGVDALGAIFGRFEGFREIRLVPGRRGIAFVEYEAEQGAIDAKENTSGMKLGDVSIKVTYQRQ
ncbi:small nuclear ribonucleoprotein [Metarhizium album ARSEF 1941]|uniref:Small nuclear ribonucleoprotein n=1 Tax=Metarhizium album (strain ARSEF 1941) TaxID=1081103 RepID=A0A0B2X0W3_METAS|nr:small nuclear ribonucleoprotein [Metarhizium album ARSEF 1941]KHN99277.1 small nuclear ribonucleoprotein [Metarhizium album ARSEF 1941]